MIINIEGLDKARVLLELYNHAQCQGIAFNRVGINVPIDGTMEKAIEKMRCIEKKIAKMQEFHVDYIDLGCGRFPIKTVFTKTTIDVRDYDYYHGAGLARCIIISLREDVEKKTDVQEAKESMAKIMALLSTDLTDETDDSNIKSDEESSECFASEEHDTPLKLDEDDSEGLASEEENSTLDSEEVPDDEYQLHEMSFCTLI